MRGRTDTGKGSDPRPRQVSREQWELNYDLACGNIGRSTYYRKKKLLREQGKWMN
jgi:hypothetical protein